MLLTPVTQGAIPNQTQTEQMERIRFERELLDKEDLPLPDGGIILQNPEDMASFDFFKEARALEASDIKKYGYIKRPSYVALYLRQQKIKAADDVTTFDSMIFAFDFPKIQERHLKKVIGFAPSGSFIENGWTGGVELFITNYGVCRLEVNAITVSHGSIILDKTQTTFLINGKPTVTRIEGIENPINPIKSALLYTVEWYDATYFRKIECEAHDYNTNHLERMLDMARASD